MTDYFASLTTQLQKYAHPVPFAIHPGSEEILIEVTLGKRTQSVAVTMKFSKSAGCQTLRLVSRACPAENHQRVRSALSSNWNLELGGFSLDASTNPPVLDIDYKMVASGLILDEFVHVVHQIAAYADYIEQRTVGTDMF